MLASLFGRSRTHPGTRSVKEPGHATPAETGCHPSPGDAEVDPHGASLALRTPASQVICPTSHSGGLDAPRRSPPDPRSHHTRRGLERLPSPKPGGTCLAWQSSETPTAAPHQMRGARGGLARGRRAGRSWAHVRADVCLSQPPTPTPGLSSLPLTLLPVKTGPRPQGTRGERGGGAPGSLETGAAPGRGVASCRRRPSSFCADR